MIERDFDIPFVADLALREKQIQQNYRPVIAVHKWFARRPGSLFRGLLLSEFSAKPLREAYYQSNSLPGLRVADPFMGGGTPLLEANRVGCDVIGFDINPMSFWIVKEEMEHLDLKLYEDAAWALREALTKEIGHLYRTKCVSCGSADADVKYFMWVKTKTCRACQKDVDLFPGYRLSANVRHPKSVFVCPKCGELTETDDERSLGKCGHCGCVLSGNGPAKRNRCSCPHCAAGNTFPDPEAGPPRHRLFAIEYYCPTCKANHEGRFFKKADQQDLAHVSEAETRWQGMHAEFVPEEAIPSGDETDRLHRWGYRYYREMFNSRQLVALELSARFVAATADERLRNALATNLSDLLRYQNMLCRYDPVALKSLDIFSVHGFPVGLIQCESNLLGIIHRNTATCTGSGGWANIIEKFRKAKAYCENPFEIRYRGGRKELVPIEGEWIGDHRNGSPGREKREIRLSCANAAEVALPPASLDAVLTDPPYFGNVQYAELMDFCYVWLRRLVDAPGRMFAPCSTRNSEELTANENMGRGLAHFTRGLSEAFQRVAKALKPGSPLAFTYHHNDIVAYYPAAVAVLDAGLTCSASLPCPAEMGASIHISGTGSSIIDTVFVCRSAGSISRGSLADTPGDVADLVRADLEKLEAGNVKPTLGDARCIAYGHLTRLAIWSLRKQWDRNQTIDERLARVANWLREFGGWSEVEKRLTEAPHTRRLSAVRENLQQYGAGDGEVSF